MVMHPNRYINFLLRLLFLAVVGVLLYIGFKYVLKWIIPLIIAYLISCIIIRPVNALHQRFKIPRQVSSILFTLLTVTLLGVLIYALVSFVVTQLTQLYNALPGLISILAKELDNIQLVFDELVLRMPSFFQGSPQMSLDSILANITLPSINVGGIFSSAAGVATSLPGMIITTVFIFVATYFLTSEREAIMGFVRRQIGDSFYDIVAELKNYFTNSVFKWIKAQIILICITSVVLLIWFSILRQPYAVILAILIAIIDALPILGVGTVMIPWALIDLLTGNFRMAIFHILVYVSVLVVRNSIEPKIVGAQLGLHPFVILLCVFFGFQLSGFLGMFLLPMAMLCLIRLQETGRIRLWK